MDDQDLALYDPEQRSESASKEYLLREMGSVKLNRDKPNRFGIRKMLSKASRLGIHLPETCRVEC